MPAVYQLLGYPGTGKYTVARAMVEQLRARGEPAALLDNHAFLSLVWQLVPDARRFDPPVMARVNELRRLLVESAAELAGPEHSIIFTNFVPPQAPGSVIDPHRNLAQTLGKQLVAVVLHCDRDEVLARVPSPDRTARYKLDDARIAARVMDEGMSLPDWPELCELDTTGLAAEETAARILAMST